MVCHARSNFPCKMALAKQQLEFAEYTLGNGVSIILRFYSSKCSLQPNL